MGAVPTAHRRAESRWWEPLLSEGVRWSDALLLNVGKWSEELPKRLRDFKSAALGGPSVHFNASLRSLAFCAGVLALTDAAAAGVFLSTDAF